jgi:hypothetical protein
VTVEENESSWTLERGGEPYFIKGVGGTRDNGHVGDYGANSVRTWGNVETTIALQDVAGTSTTICAGFWFDGNSLSLSTLTTIVNYVDAHKNDDAILIWTIGNQVHLGFEDILPEIFSFIDIVAAVIKWVDPNHPTMTTIADLPESVIPYLRELKHVDIIGVNAYSSGSTVGSRYAAAAIGKPFILTEFGPAGWWDEPQTSFGAPIEPSSTSRITAYRNTYESTVLQYQSTNCLGSYAFYWGWKNETTPTWFGMFYRDGSRLSPVEAMTELWNGSLPNDWNRVPVVTNFAISKSTNLRVAEPIEVDCPAMDPDGDNLTWSFELVSNTVVSCSFPT